MLQSGVGYSFSNSSGGSSLTIDTITRYKETLPFFVYEDSDASGNTVFRINAGTFNNVFPTVNGATVGDAAAYLAAPTATSLVVLTVPATGGANPAWPAGTPTIALLAGTTVPGFGPTVARLALAKITVTTEAGSGVKTYAVSNLVSGSLWGERFECGEELEYWFSRI
jgi:hypothetical protein